MIDPTEILSETQCMWSDIHITDDPLKRIEKEFLSTDQGFGHDISGPFWMLMRISIHKGPLSWVVDGQDRAVSLNNVWLYVPPWSWATRKRFPGLHIHVAGVIEESNSPFSQLTEPTLLKSDVEFPKSFDELTALQNQFEIVSSVPLAGKPSSLALRFKDKIDKVYQRDVKLAELATELRSSLSVCSRAFKNNYGFSPRKYRQGLRITQGTYALMRGMSPDEAAAIAGHRDLSRFYKQFKGYMKMTPGAHSKKSKSAKKD